MSVGHMSADVLVFSTEVDNSWDAVDSSLRVSLLPESFQGQRSKTEAQHVNNYLPTLPIKMPKWSDDFKPNTQAKQNREGVWVCTVTFCS